jgi:hypothetical protein
MYHTVVHQLTKMSTMSDRIRSDHTRLKQAVAATDYDLGNLLNKSTKVSATRLRAQLMNISKLCNSLRKDILAHSKEMPTRKKKVTINVEEGTTEAEPEQPGEPAPETAAPPPSPKKTRKPRRKKVT